MTHRGERFGYKTFVAFVIGGLLVGLTSCGRPVKYNSAVQTEEMPASFARDSFAKELAVLPQAAKETKEKRVQGRFAYFQTPAEEVPRRIIYEAALNLVVKDMAETETAISKLLKEHGGYVGESNVDRRQGEHLTGHWKVRVPAPQFDPFMEAVAKLGVAESRSQTAQDVTAEYVDLEAQISNKKKLEERIVALLKDANGKIKDVIEVEHELARVRGEIEQIEGRLRYLANRTDMTTIAITAREEENYVPPAAPRFGNRIAQAWGSSLESLQSFGERLVVATVSATPWLAVVGVVLVPGTWFAKRMRRGMRG
jgi:hypothetical protein